MEFRSQPQLATERMAWERFIAGVTRGEKAGARQAGQCPDELRTPTWAMKRALLRGEHPTHAWNLVRALDVSEDCVDDDVFSRWLASGALKKLSVLRCLGRGLSVESVLRAVEELDELRVLELAGSWWDGPARSLRPSKKPTQMARLALHGLRAEAIASFLEHPAFIDVDELAVSAVVGDGRWWDRGALAQRQSVAISAFGGDEDDAESLAGALPRTLASLSFQTTGGGRRVVAMLARELPGLRRLDLARNGLADAALVSAPLVLAGTLQYLSLAHNPIRGRVIRSLGEQLASIEVLDLAGTHVGDASLGKLPQSAPLRCLDLTGTECTAESVLPLLRHAGDSLRYLSVSATEFGTSAVTHLGADVALPELETLNLARCPIGGRGLVHVLSEASLPRLRTLVVDGTQLTDCDFQKTPTARNLEALRLDRCRFATSRPGNLFAAEALPKLGALNLGMNHLDLRSVDALARLATQRPLTCLELDESLMVGADAIAAVVEATAESLVELKVGQGFADPAALVEALGRAALRSLRRLDLLGLILDADSLRAILANSSLGALESLVVQVDGPETAMLLAASSTLASLRSVTVHGGAVDQESSLQQSVSSPWLDVMVIPSP
jgi:hypothetical protein